MVGASSKGKDEREEHDANDGDDFERREPEFEFTEELDTKVIDGQDDDEEDGNEYTRIHFLSIDPVLNDKSGSCQLIGSDDNVLDPIATIVSDYNESA